REGPLSSWLLMSPRSGPLKCMWQHASPMPKSCRTTSLSKPTRLRMPKTSPCLSPFLAQDSRQQRTRSPSPRTLQLVKRRWLSSIRCIAFRRSHGVSGKWPWAYQGWLGLHRCFPEDQSEAAPGDPGSASEADGPFWEEGREVVLRWGHFPGSPAPEEGEGCCRPGTEGDSEGRPGLQEGPEEDRRGDHEDLRQGGR